VKDGYILRNKAIIWNALSHGLHQGAIPSIGLRQAEAVRLSVGEPPLERCSTELIQMSEEKIIVEKDDIEVPPQAMLQSENKDE
jgi:hypothetical protein